MQRFWSSECDGRALAFGETVTTDTTVINNICWETPATLQVIKIVDNTDGGSAISSDFSINVLLTGNNVAWSPAPGNAMTWTTYTLYADTYLVTENTSGSYSATYGWDCSLTGSVSLLAGDSKTCIITNTFVPNAWGGSTTVEIDNCPNGDNSWNPYDWTCVRSTVTSTSQSQPDQPQQQGENSWADWSVMTTTTSPDYTIEPFQFWFVQPNTETWTITLLAQLPNTWATVSESNNFGKNILVLIFWLSVFVTSVFVIKKSYVTTI